MPSHASSPHSAAILPTRELEPLPSTRKLQLVQMNMPLLQRVSITLVRLKSLRKPNSLERTTEMMM
jgi:hypothetical protein